MKDQMEILELKTIALYSDTAKENIRKLKVGATNTISK